MLSTTSRLEQIERRKREIKQEVRLLTIESLALEDEEWELRKGDYLISGVKRDAERAVYAASDCDEGTSGA